MQNDKLVNVLISVVASFIVSFFVAITLAGKNETVSVANTADINIDKSIEDYLMNNPSVIRRTLELAAQQERAEAEKRVAENYKTILMNYIIQTTHHLLVLKMQKSQLLNFLISTVDIANV